MQKRALVTGASRGIGVELTKQLAAAGWCVYATCRARTTELDSINLNGGHVIENVDVATSDGTSAILKGISERKIDGYRETGVCDDHGYGYSTGALQEHYV
jgi:NAD(P)-dependent dehydrogenase (short-subunit alcohol dehydrogenase family)